MLTTTTVTSMWQAIRRVERALAEQDRRTAASSSARPAVSPSVSRFASSSARSSVSPSASPSVPVPMAPAAPVLVRPGPDESDRWMTVFEAPAAAEPAALTVYLRVRAELPADDPPADVAPAAVRVLVGAAELFTASVDELAADRDGYTVAGPFDPPAADQGAEPVAAVPVVRVQVRGPAAAELAVWPPWLVWQAATAEPGHS